MELGLGKMFMVMKKTFVYIMAAIAAIAAVSCSKIENEQVEKGLTFTASFDPEVRTTIGTGNAVSWVDGDVITIVDESNVKVSHTISEAAGDNINGNSVTFTVTSTDLDGKTLSGQLYAIHGGANPSFSNGSFHFDIPTDQDGSFNQANICVAKADGANLAFKNATAIVHFINCDSNYSASPFSNGKKGTINSISVSTLPTMTVSFSNPISASGSGNEISISKSGTISSEYYFAVAPGSCTFTVSASNTNGKKGSFTNTKELSLNVIYLVNAGNMSFQENN